MKSDDRTVRGFGAGRRPAQAADEARRDDVDEGAARDAQHDARATPSVTRGIDTDIPTEARGTDGAGTGGVGQDAGGYAPVPEPESNG